MRAGRVPSPPPAPPATELPGPLALGVVGLWAAVLLLAPPESNFFWAVNGFRSVPLAARAALLVAAALGALAVLRPLPLPAWLAIAAVAAGVVAFPLRESIHLLGDTWVRMRLIEFDASGAIPPQSFGEIADKLHASPLDALGTMGVLWLGRAGVPPEAAVSAASFALALAFALGVWRVAARLDPQAGAPLAAAAAVSGAVQAFAGYAESAGILLAAAAWWWAMLLAPLARRRDTARLAVAWAVMFLAHRLALAMLLAQAWRAAGTPLLGDRPGPRRLLLALTIAGAGLAVLLATAGPGRFLRMDLTQLTGALGGGGGRLRLVPLHDVANLLALVAPLFLLAPALAGARGLRGLAARPEARLALAAALPLTLQLAVFPVAPNGLGAHRDWDLNVLTGLTLTVASLLALTGLPLGRLRGALAALVPVLVLGAGGWIAVNADPRASERRAAALAYGSPALPDEQRGAVLSFLGYRASDLGDDRRAAECFEQAFSVHHNLGHAMRAAESWLRAGDPAAARRALAAGRARGPLPPAIEGAARMLDRMIAAAESTAAAPPLGR
ncbi:MAG TPA: hypothetical protein VGK89_06060 [Candidatus Eisenbacteria bacterium]